MRHLAIKFENGNVVSTNGTLSDRVAKRMENKAPGLYNVSITSDRSLRPFIQIGRCIAQGPAAMRTQLERLDRMASDPAAKNRSGAPGIAGFQQRQDAANESARSAKRRTAELAEWLRKQLAQGEAVERTKSIGTGEGIRRSRIARTARRVAYLAKELESAHDLFADAADTFRSACCRGHLKVDQDSGEMVCRKCQRDCEVTEI